MREAIKRINKMRLKMNQIKINKKFLKRVIKFKNLIFKNLIKEEVRFKNFKKIKFKHKQQISH